MSKPTCFISYCHSDIDRDALEFLITEIQTHARQQITFYFDEDLPFGKRFDQFMDHISDVDVILVIFTPAYKRKTLERSGGVYTEYKKIVAKYEANARADLKTARGGFASVIPIILSGCRETSVPDAFKDARALNLAGLIVRRTGSGRLQISEGDRSKFNHFFTRIAAQIIVKDALETDEYRKSEEQYYDDLFVKLKAGERPIPKNVLLETAAYKLVQNQTSFFVIGRKGTGKSTLTRMLQTLNPEKYIGFVGIRADNINLQLSYLQITQGRDSDLEAVLKPLNYFKLGWLGFFSLCMIDLLLRLQGNGKLSDAQSSRMEPLATFYLKHFNEGSSNDESQTAMFIFATQKVGEFFEQSITESPSSGQFSTLLSQVITRFTPEAYLRFLLGDKALEALESVVDCCQRRVLLTLDDFDTVFDAFRRRASDDADRRLRARVEVDWLRSLLVVVSECKTEQKDVWRCFRTVDFSMTIPQDRFAEIERSDRDGYRYNQATANILWSGIELCELLVLRLQALSGYLCTRRTTRERFDEIMEKHWPELPLVISFTFNGFPIKIPLFNYILRHTFWRPRDILLYFGSLLAAAMNIRTKGESIDAEVVRRIISETTRRIIGTEFLKEYETAIPLIDHVIRAFTSSPQAMSFEDLLGLVGRLSFGVAAEDDERVDMDRKIEILYEIGFLGVQFDQRFREILNVGDECFYFNEGRSPLKAMRQSNYKAGKFVVHPIFAEHLLLDYSKNSFLLNLTWDYISRTHSIIVSSAKGW